MDQLAFLFVPKETNRGYEFLSLPDMLGQHPGLRCLDLLSAHCRETTNVTSLKAKVLDCMAANQTVAPLLRFL